MPPYSGIVVVRMQLACLGRTAFLNPFLKQGLRCESHGQMLEESAVLADRRTRLTASEEVRPAGLDRPSLDT